MGKKLKLHTDDVVIKKAIDEDWLSSLAFYHYVQATFKRPVLYNYTVASASEKLGVSKATVHGHVRKLKEVGLAYMVGKNLNFMGTTRMRKVFAKRKKITTFIAYDNWNLRDFLDALRLVVIRENEWQQVYALRDKTKDKVQVERSERVTECTVETGSIPGEINYDIGMGLRRMGKLIGLSKSGAKQFIDRMYKRRWINYKDIKKRLGGVAHDISIIKSLNEEEINWGYIAFDSMGAYLHKGRYYSFMNNTIKIMYKGI